jgi:nitrite reductase (NO-forming)
MFISRAVRRVALAAVLLLPSVLLAQAKVDGARQYAISCQMCHMPNGQGVPNAFPPLAQADYLMKLAKAKDRTPLVQIVLQGLRGKIVVNGKTYTNLMPPVVGLDDARIAAVLTYVTNSWGNQARPFTEAEVKKARQKIAAASSSTATGRK